MLAVAITKSRFDGKYHATLEGNEYLGNGFTGEGKTKTDAQASLQTAILRQEGFTWNRKRNAWQHSCGFFSKNAQYDPRWKYGEVNAEELIAA